MTKNQLKYINNFTEWAFGDKKLGKKMGFKLEKGKVTAYTGQLPNGKIEA